MNNENINNMLFSDDYRSVHLSENTTTKTTTQSYLGCSFLLLFSSRLFEIRYYDNYSKNQIDIHDGHGRSRFIIYIDI